MKDTTPARLRHFHARMIFESQSASKSENLCLVCMNCVKRGEGVGRGGGRERESSVE